MSREIEPSTFEQAAAALAAAAADGHGVRIRGAGTKLDWGTPVPPADTELRTTRLNRIVEHNAGDLTAVLEAGVPLAAAQRVFARAGQRLALDPPLGAGSTRAATVGGVVATGDCGPLRHRYGAPRDLLLGMTAALSDGTIARSGGKVIKNVAGYDVAKLFAGAFGTLGAILAVNVRLHPLPQSTATALGAGRDADRLAAAARTLTRAPLELEALDVAWRRGRGGILACCGGAEATARAQAVARSMRDADLDRVDVSEDDADLWARQRAGQRSENAAVLRVAARPSELAHVLRAADACGGALVGRAALGTSYVVVEPEYDAIDRLRRALPEGVTTVLLDAPLELRRALDPWGGAGGPVLELMRRIKRRFDPAGACNRGVFVGGI